MRRYLLNITYILFFSVALGYPQINFARTHLQDSSRIDYSAFESMFTLFPSFLFQNISKMKSYVRSNEFSEYKNQYGDLAAVDEIFHQAYKITRGNTSIALLLCTSATLDHYTLGIRVPILNIYIPLTDETKEEFQQRVENLPGQIYLNSPKTKYGDRDKLQHFFGSAFLVYVFESQNAAQNYSEFVEKFEDRYINNGSYDLRDMKANEDGQSFGLALSKNQKIKPSDVFSSK
jgi:hypothetical protein